MVEVPSRTFVSSATIDQFLQDDIKIDAGQGEAKKLLYEFTLEDTIRDLAPSAISILSLGNFFTNFPSKTLVVTYKQGVPSFTIRDRAHNLTVAVPAIISNSQRTVHQPIDFAAVSVLVHKIIADCSKDSDGSCEPRVDRYEIQATTISIIIETTAADRLSIDLSLFCAQIAPPPQTRVKNTNYFGYEPASYAPPPTQLVPLLKYIRITPDNITLYFPRHIRDTKRKAE
jgi:hypothetical protein